MQKLVFRNSECVEGGVMNVLPYLMTVIFSFFFVGHASAAVVAAGGGVEKVAPGFGFAEGPVADGEGGILFVDINRGGTRARPGRILRFDTSDDSVSVLYNSENTILNDAGAIGIDRMADGTIVLARGDFRTLSKFEGGVITTLAEHWTPPGGGGRAQGTPQIFNGPNDLVGDSLGGVYFTDPNFLGGTTVAEAVYYYSPEGEVLRVASGLNGPNGIGLSPDGGTIYIAATRESKVYSYDVLSNGELENKRLFAETRTDGMTLDLLGNVYLTDTSASGVRVFNSAGAALFTIDVPEHSTNLAFADDGRTLYITGLNNLYRVPILNIPEPGSGMVLYVFLGLFCFVGLFGRRVRRV